jgi:hypothetical protein
VYYIDGMPTVLKSVHGDLAHGYTIGNDLTTTECYVARGHGYFAHGKTAREATSGLECKILSGMDTDTKVEEFVKRFDKDGKYPVRDFYEWHGLLTGSCKFGRDSFAKEHDISMDGEMGTREFLALTKDAFGSEVIRAVIERMGLADEIK